MTLDEALRWADNFGPIQSDPPTGDPPALMVLAAEVRRLQAEIERLREGAGVKSVKERLIDAGLWGQFCAAAKARDDERLRAVLAEIDETGYGADHVVHWVKDAAPERLREALR